MGQCPRTSRTGKRQHHLERFQNRRRRRSVHGHRRAGTHSGRLRGAWASTPSTADRSRHYSVGVPSQTTPWCAPNTWDRFKFGGQPGKDTRVYFFNTKELVGNNYGTPNPVPFRVVDKNIGLDMDIAIRFFGQYSYRISDPILFYRNVAGNFPAAYSRDQIDGQLKAELLSALQPAVAKISALGVRYSALPGHTSELAEALNDVLTPKWRQLRGLEIVSLAVASVNASPEDEQVIKSLQRTAVLRDPTMAAATLVGAQASALEAAAANESGAMVGFMGLGMAQGATGGTNPSSLYAMGANSSLSRCPPRPRWPRRDGPVRAAQPTAGSSALSADPPSPHPVLTTAATSVAGCHRTRRRRRSSARSAATRSMRAILSSTSWSR